MQAIHDFPAESTSYLEGLNPEQRQAVETVDGPVLVLAGAGTGKTRVLTTRLAHILQTGKAFPSQILAVTFTNKAAQEMKERVSHIMGGQPVDGWWLGTFHALATRMLRRHADLVGLKSDFTILDPDDQARLMKQIMELNGLDTKKWAPKLVIGLIDRWKDRGLTPDKVPPEEAAGEAVGGKLHMLYKLYQQRLLELNASDFGNLLLHMLTILRDPANAEVLAQYHHQFRYILVDEYQDTNVAQYLWLRLLAQGSNNVCCVGDDDQSIYGWRGAEVGNILRFEKDFPGALVIRLEQNYRSTGRILEAAHGVISKNENRLGKKLWSAGDEGEKLKIQGLWDGEAEARWVGEEIEQLQRQGFSLKQIAVLVRAGFQTREFEERFIKLGLPYKVIGGSRFFERREIRDALAYLRVVAQPADDLALERIINVPKRNIGDVTVHKLYAHARTYGVSLYNSIQEICQTDELGAKVKTTLMKLLDDFERWRAFVPNMHQAELTALILEESGYNQMWKEDKTPEAPGRLENLRELISSLQDFTSLQEFLEHVALVLENQDQGNGDSLSIMTLHGAKGLEFDAVFLPGWEEGLFPSQRSLDETGLKGLEEERRLAYVGITRARKRAFISFVGSRRLYGNWVTAIPSRFIDELPAEHVDVSSDQGLYGAKRSSHWDTSPARALHTRSVPAAPASSPGAKVQTAGGLTFERGERVFHDKFGYGKIIHIDGHKLDIAFEKSGSKRVMDSFIQKA
ncbi:MAG: UvrD-helicase domain-containing protein [Alphaproteobacteria bacterium]|nr:UvrD-helicase domain-containing protein [Alphaproteobacteria bacterium]